MSDAPFTVTEQPKPRTHAAPLDHAKKAVALQAEWATRVRDNTIASAELFAGGIDPETWGELLEMAISAQERLSALQRTWLQQWTAWINYSDQIKGANTMAKFAERESNIMAQYSQLLGAQASSLIGLEENIEVAYSYWVHQKLASRG